MNEANVRQEVYRLLRRLHYTPHRLKDAYSPVNIKRTVGLLKSLYRYISAPPARATLAVAIKGIEGSLKMPPSGRPDILANSAHGPGVYVEVKVINLKATKTFAFSHLTPEQRQYLDHRTKEGFRCYLALGTVNAPRQGKLTGRRLWIVDWLVWLTIEDVLCPHQASIPVVAGKGYFKALQEQQLDLNNLGYYFECHREHGMWHIPGIHSLWQTGAPPGEKEL